MAKKRYQRMKQKKIEPAQLTLLTNTTTVAPGATGEFTLDLSQLASLANRRFYRQGINWAVAGFKIYTSAGIKGNVTIKALPNTWITSNAWEKAFRAWNKQQMEAIEDSGAESAVAAFRDFKIFADPKHVADGYVANMQLLDGQLPAAQPYANGEWEPSIVVLPNSASDGSSLVEPSERFLHMCGINVNGTVSRGIIEGYADSRAYPHSPDPVSPDIASSQNWLSRMFDVGNDINEIVENATDRNDNLPYPQVDYPGGATQAPAMVIHDLCRISGTTVGGTTYGKGGNFPCGLIRFEWSNDVESSTSSNIAIQIDLVPGDHRGYLCEPMTEM